MEIAAFERKRDDNHVMAPPLKVARMLVSRLATGSKARRRFLGIHDIRFDAECASLVCGCVVARFVRYTAGELAVAESSQSRPEGV